MDDGRNVRPDFRKKRKFLHIFLPIKIFPTFFEYFSATIGI